MMDALIRSTKVLICAGSGGVGKTTIAAAVAVRSAELGLKTLVLTVDPAKRLATTLGIDSEGARDTRVPKQSFKGELFASVLDSRRIFDDFVRSSAASAELTERLMQNSLYAQLSTTLSGSQEFTALEKLHQAVTSGHYDLIVLDTPPTQHALDFLTAPRKIENLFQESVTKWFTSGGAPGGWIRGLMSQGTRQALKAMESLTGSKFIETLVEFFSSVRSFQATLRQHSREVREILTDSSTRFVLVTSFDLAKLKEAQYFLTELSSRQYHVGAVVINRAFPDWLGEVGEIQSELGALVDLHEKMRHFYADRIALYNQFQDKVKQEIPVLKIPEFHQDISELKGLQHVYGSLRA